MTRLQVHKGGLMRMTLIVPGESGWTFAFLPIFNISKYPMGWRVTIGALIFLFEFDFGDIEDA